jgi:hypothetical protein
MIQRQVVVKGFLVEKFFECLFYSHFRRETPQVRVLMEIFIA